MDCVEAAGIALLGELDWMVQNAERGARFVGEADIWRFLVWERGVKTLGDMDEYP